LNLSYTTNSDSSKLSVFDANKASYYNIASYTGTLNLGDASKLTIIRSQNFLRRETGYTKYKIYDEGTFIADTDYGTPTGGTMSYATIPASGGTISSGTLGGTVSQTRTYTSGSSDTYSQATPTNGTYGTAISAPSLGATIKNAATVGTLIYTYTLNGKTGTVGNIVTQAGNYVTSLTLSSGSSNKLISSNTNI
jgi:hypothetical protein